MVLNGRVSKIGDIELPYETQDVAAGCKKRNTLSPGFLTASLWTLCILGCDTVWYTGRVWVEYETTVQRCDASCLTYIFPQAVLEGCQFSWLQADTVGWLYYVACN